MANGMLIETTRDWIVVKIPRRLVRAKRKAVLTATEALKVFQKGRKEYRVGKLKAISSLKEIL